MDGFKTLKRTGISVSAGDRQGLGTLRHRGRRRERDRHGQERSATSSRRSSGERSFTIATELGREPADRQPQLHGAGLLAPGVTSTRRSPTRIGGGGDTNIMMDGVSVMDTGSNRPLLQMNVESIAGSEGADVGLPGRIRPLERPADHRGHQERHQPLPRLALRRRAQFRLERQQQDEQAQRRSEDRSSKESDWGFRSAARSASRAATTSCSSSTARNSRRARRRQRRRSGSACRRRSNGRETSRRRPTTTATRIRYIKDPQPRRRLHRGETRPRASATAACSAGFRPTGCIRPG